MSQARFGLGLDHIRNESRGISIGHPSSSVGYLWNQPPRADQSLGLGKSITWQWDSRVCDVMKVEENFWGIPLVSCDSMQASVHRAFDTWSMNSRHVKFTDVTQQCAELGYTTTRCPLAEVWVTSFDFLESEPHNDPTISIAHPQYTEYFRNTNEQVNYRLLNAGTSNEVRRGRTVTETVGATIAFRTKDTCWYLDSDFCSGFHRWKQIWDGPKAAYAVGVTLFFTFWVCMMIFACCFTSVGAFVAYRKHAQLRIDTQLDEGVPFTPAPFVESVSAVVASFSVTGLALRLLLISIIWPMYTAMFSTCWSCYDFEAGAAHEVGHLLGLGHPELAPHETMTGYEPWGRNSYHEHLATGAALNASTCVNPWEDVRQGVPTGAATDAMYTTTDVRPSIMFDFTLHNPRTCLEDDDLEALNTLYPDCLGGPTTPLCTKPPLNLGWLRVLLALWSYCIFLVVAAAWQLYARYRLRKFRRFEYMPEILKDLRRKFFPQRLRSPDATLPPALPALPAPSY